MRRPAQRAALPPPRPPLPPAYVTDTLSLVQVRNVKIPGFAPRQLLTENIWKWNSDKTVLVFRFHSIDNSPEFPPNPRWVRINMAGKMTYEQLPPRGDVPQTKFSWLTQIHLGANVPRRFVLRLGPKQLNSAVLMRKALDQSLSIDRVRKVKYVEAFTSHTDEYTEEENRIVSEGLRYFDIFDKGNPKVIKSQFPYMSAKSTFVNGRGYAWGMASTTIRANVEEVLWYVWDVHSRENAREDDLEREVLESPSAHNHLVYVKKRLSVISYRDFLNRFLWKKTSKSGREFVCVTSPEESELRPSGEGDVVRGKYPSIVRLTRLKENSTRIEYVINLNFGGTVPQWITNTFTVVSLSWICEIGEYFQRDRRLEVWDEDDGGMVAEMLVVPVKAERFREGGETKYEVRVRELYKTVKGLGEVGEKYDWFDAMLAKLIESKLRPARDVNTRLFNLSRREAQTIGAGLALALATNLTSEAGVDEWIVRYPALKELDKREVWFRPMVNVCAMRILGEVSWGVKLRVFMGAGLSVLDMFSDIYVVALYWNQEGKRGFAVVLLAMILASIFMQLLVVLFQNTKRTKKVKRTLLFESMIVLTGMKPGVDAFRVSSGVRRDADHSFAPRTELVATKVCELVFESIPGCFVLVYAVLKSASVEGERSAIFSVLISALTTGFSSASISFDMVSAPLTHTPLAQGAAAAPLPLHFL